MYFEDMSNYCYYLKTPLDNVKNIGWLNADKSCSTGDVDTDFLSKLSKIILGNEVIDTQVNRIRSVHPCSLANCEVAVITDGMRSAFLGAAEIWIPSGKSNGFFAMPSMIFHYIEKHHYLPPSDFISAVVNFDFEKPFNAQEVYLAEIKGHF
jgi:hypothetical protein